MKNNNDERICLGPNGKDVMTVFNSDLRKAHEAAEILMNGLGIEFNTETAHDIISGGFETEARLEEMLRTALENAVFPFQKQEVQTYGDKMHQKLRDAVKLNKRLIGPDYGLSSMMFYVDSDGALKVCDEGISILKDAELLYIDKPEQIEIYHDCVAIIKAIQSLEEKVSKYGMSATLGGRAVLSLGGEIHINPGNIADCYPGNYLQRTKA